MEITVAYGRPLGATVDGATREVWTTASEVGEALAFLNLDAPDSKLSTSRSTGITHEGLAVDIAMAKDVTRTVAGAPTSLTVAGTVADDLANGKSAVVRINDRGPYISGRCLDLSTAAMSQIGGTSSGVVSVAYEVVG